MAALTAALIGGAAIGGLIAGRKLKKKNPAPTPPAEEASLAPPVTPRAAIEPEAQRVKVEQRKKARGQGRQSTILTGPSGVPGTVLTGTAPTLKAVR